MPSLAQFKTRLFSAQLFQAIWLIAAGCAGSSGEAIASAKILKFGYILSDESQLGQAEKVFAAEVLSHTSGRYVIEDYPASMLGGDVAMMDNVKLGAIDLAFITGAPLPKLLPEAGVFNIPFLFHDALEARAVLDGPIGAEYLQKFDRTGLIALAWGENGMRHITTSQSPVRRPEDLAGLKLRLPQSDVMKVAFKAIGADVRQIPFPQVYGALRSGSVEGQENPIGTIMSAKFYEVQKYLTLTGHVYDPAVIIMSNDAYEALSEADKQTFIAAAKSAADESRKAASQSEQDGIAFLKANGMVVIETVDKTAFEEAVATAFPDYERQFGHSLIERIKQAVALVHEASGNTGKIQAPR